MLPATIILIAWIVFGGSHIILSSSNIRHQMSPHKFTSLFVLVTIITMSGLMVACALYADQGIAGPSIGKTGIFRWMLTSVSFLGAILMIAGLINFPNSAIAVLARKNRTGVDRNFVLSPPNGLERITRHPFFVGLAIVTLVHTFQATTLASSVYFAGFCITSLVGIYMQDRKLRERWQKIYENYEGQTGALIQNPNSAEGDRQPWKIWTSALIISVVFFLFLHPIWAFANGAAFAMFILVFGTLATLVSVRKSKSFGQTNDTQSSGPNER